ncbi:myosin heavy chain-related protein [Artemisia annua]|uniref:Myosin heavy chain-related protein n=1 Tax=Artemisia annua TaxID=35608 RepID=A0A2U1KI58_ARTAN|nr:myosin heavy chain-related protein [Artemisia annua]
MGPHFLPRAPAAITVLPPNPKEQVQKAHTRALELEKQVEKLQLELDLKAGLRKVLIKTVYRLAYRNSVGCCPLLDESNGRCNLFIAKKSS